ncbi:hypothetical protein J2X20_003304 [Pelomonas saccharophila]|uniref:D-alanyl-D-alanine carboxypeptidase-like core domain-containing protein n=1 Tax=Roseateles saccharophilus TaxID=304 RepID=A0ABU1YP60_ROSSA|nr:D-alanyl-D-alanine carboxypeptidase family protein [Roseateles saccharophilus]MDR7270646.1 hypothetical protein [Roseateles saccharophilus]
MAAPTYEVTAEALNLRDQAGTQGRVLGVLKRGDVVVGAQPAQGGWMAVAAGALNGFVASAFLRGVQATAGTAPPPPTADVNVKDRDLARLHPAMRAKVEELLQLFAQQSLPFRVFEAYRSPERQNWLYEQGRTRPGGKVTNARAWESFHQYGLAVDFVLFENGQWSWDDSGPRAGHWRKLRELIDQVGLHSLSWEVPHAELHVQLADLRAGRWPDGGDDSWHDLMEAAVDRWRGQNLPGAPTLASTERPPLIA